MPMENQYTEEPINSNVERTISTNIGEMPMEEYLDIAAIQNGFENYEDMKAHGYSMNGAEAQEQLSSEMAQTLEHTEQEIKQYVTTHTDMLKERSTVVINAFGGAGAGKTTACLGITEELKKAGYLAEYVQEYAKELVWEENWEKLDGTAAHQFEILKEQTNRMDRMYGKVDFIVTDAPVLLNKVYNNELTKSYEKSLVDLYKQYNNFNFVVERDPKSFEQEGRIHNLQESMEKDSQIETMLKEHNLYFGKYNHTTTQKVVENAVKTLERTKKQVQKDAPKEKEAFQGYAYAKGTDKVTVVNGTSEDNIVKKLNAWNAARTEDNKFKTCNISELNPESNKYEGYKKIDIVSGKDITPTYLELPKLPRNEFKSLTEELKKNGVSFNSFNKRWYITPDVEQSKIEVLLADKDKESMKESKIPQEEMKIPEYTVEFQYVLNVENMQEPIRIDMKKYPQNEKDIEDLLHIFEDAIKEKNIENTQDSQMQDDIQKELISEVGNKNLNPDAIKLLAQNDFSPAQREEIQSGLQEGLSAEQVMHYAKPELEPWQMNFSRYGMVHGVSNEEIEKVIFPKLSIDEDWKNRKDKLDSYVNDKRMNIAKNIQKNGFKANPNLVKKIERLNHLSGKQNSIKDIAQSFKGKLEQGNEDIKELINEIGSELKIQEMEKMIVPEA